MDNRLRETAVTVAVWASSQYALDEVWFAGPRAASAQPSQEPLEIIIVMAGHEQQVAARKEGRQVSTSTWEADLRRAVRGVHGLKMLNAGAIVSDAQAVRIFSRHVSVAPEITCVPRRDEPVSAASNTYNADTRGDIGNARTL